MPPKKNLWRREQVARSHGKRQASQELADHDTALCTDLTYAFVQALNRATWTPVPD
jgi:hypothetical protein